MSVRIQCSEPECAASIADNAWAKRRASDWFFMRDNTQWCSDHIPEWVGVWRDKKAKQ